MALNLKRGPKNQIWQEVVVTHHDDMGKVYHDKFDILVRTPSEVDDLQGEADDIRAASTDKEESQERTKKYLRDNILGWRKLIDTSNADIPFNAENFDDLLCLALYRLALINVVSNTRRAPVVAERKN